MVEEGKGYDWENKENSEVPRVIDLLFFFDRSTVERDGGRLKTHRRAITGRLLSFFNRYRRRVMLSLSSQGVLPPLPHRYHSFISPHYHRKTLGHERERERAPFSPCYYRVPLVFPFYLDLLAQNTRRFS